MRQAVSVVFGDDAHQCSGMGAGGPGGNHIYFGVRPGGAGGPGSCPAGSGDTHQLVLAPDGSGNAINRYNAGAAADEHSSVFAPGTLGANNDYVFFIASGAAGNPGIGDVVLSGGAGPNDHGHWTFHLPAADGYGSYLSGFGQVFRQASSEPNCPQVWSASQQDQTFDLNYAAPGSVLPDPTVPAGSLLMIYEGTNTCVGSSGGPRAGSGTAYISTGVARNARVVQSLGLGLDEKAIEAVSKWKFRPGYKDGRPVTVMATIEVNFRLL